MHFFKCSACGREIDVAAFIPNDAWAAISGGDYALCVPCIDARLAERDIACAYHLHFLGAAIRTDAPLWARQIAASFQPEIAL